MITIKNTIFVEHINFVWNDERKDNDVYLPPKDVEVGTAVYDPTCREYVVVSAVHEVNEEYTLASVIDYVGPIYANNVVEKTNEKLTIVSNLSRDHYNLYHMNYYIVVDPMTHAAISTEPLYVPHTAALNYANKTIHINFTPQI